MKKRLLIVAAANNFNFIRDIGNALLDEFEVRLWESTGGSGVPLYQEIKRSDVVWLEWADGLSMSILKAFDGPYILRIHRYELFQQRTLDTLANLSDHARIKKLLFVSNHVKQIGVSLFPWMSRGQVIPNLVDTDKFPYYPKFWGHNLLFLGRMSYVKNLPLMLHLFRELYCMDNDFRLHVVGEISDPELVYHRDNFLEKIRPDLKPAIFFHGRLEGTMLRNLMLEMHYIVSTSIFESQGVGILEAMATGMMPVVYNFSGAERLLPPVCLFMTANQFLRKFSSDGYEPEECRTYVMRNFSINENLHRYANVVRDIANG